ncbi:phage repressor protein [Sinobacterium caligoides]|uniref:Phage repressor protein n=1 Tax=Sinobacterium caligoides TaxID=933926 RepID=A0A3N2E119_9GAMM|nr:LexA family transcriptional regulator [Sinobacterium caligoides]ROS05727.1 phage repressor protein [Sinobacterium caligoides]
MNNLAKNLRARLAAVGMTQRELAEKCGISQVMVHKLLSGKSTSTTKILELSSVLDCSPEWLINGEDEEQKKPSARYCSEDGSSRMGSVPLISLVQAGDWTALMNRTDLEEPEAWQATTSNVGPHSFALRVRGDSMLNPLGFPSIPEGSIVIVDPDCSADNGKIVVARLDGTAEATLKKLVIDGPHKYLKPLNPDYRPIAINGNCSIVGVVKQVVSDL